MPDEFLLADASEGPELGRRVEKGKGCRSYHVKNEDMANGATENAPTTGRFPDIVFILGVIFLVASFSLVKNL